MNSRISIVKPVVQKEILNLSSKKSVPKGDILAKILNDSIMCIIVILALKRDFFLLN